MRAALATALAVLALVVWLWRDRLPDGRRQATPASEPAAADLRAADAPTPDVAAPPPAEPPPPAAPAAQPATEAPEAGTPPTLPERAAPPAPSPPLAATQAPVEPPRRVHRVVPGDTLWSIAQDELGDGQRARELYEANRDQIKDPHDIHPGQVLVLPRAD